MLVEKPLVFALGEADTVLAEAAQRNLFFATNFNHRYAQPLQMAQAAIATGRLGEISFASWRFGGEGSSTHPHANLIETQCHAFEQLEWLCGPLDSVMAQITDKSGKGYRTLLLALHFANGAVGSLLGSYDSSYAYAAIQSFETGQRRGMFFLPKRGSCIALLNSQIPRTLTAPETSATTHAPPTDGPNDWGG